MTGLPKLKRPIPDPLVLLVPYLWLNTKKREEIVLEV